MIQCPECSSFFERNRADQVYCSKKCKTAAFRKRGISDNRSLLGLNQSSIEFLDYLKSENTRLKEDIKVTQDQLLQAKSELDALKLKEVIEERLKDFERREREFENNKGLSGIMEKDWVKDLVTDLGSGAIEILKKKFDPDEQLLSGLESNNKELLETLISLLKKNPEMIAKITAISLKTKDKQSVLDDVISYLNSPEAEADEIQQEVTEEKKDVLSYM